ncbi:hypothetical protein NE865_00858 [Phthorimaea operculella]|nr:hypothetical protein NE865_00858 [Phthorimaea operculella]
MRLRVACGADPIIADRRVITSVVRRAQANHSFHPQDPADTLVCQLILTYYLSSHKQHWRTPLLSAMLLESNNLVLEDVLLNDQYLISPAESIFNFELPSSVFPTDSDWPSDLENYLSDARVSDNSDDYFADSAFPFDTAAFDRGIDEYLLEALSSDRSNDAHQSGTESSDSGDDLGRLFVLGTDLDSTYVQDLNDYRSASNAWNNQTEKTEPKRIFGEPEYCRELQAFRCPVAECGKLYAKASHVRAHLRRHSGEKPYRCTWAGCEWRFARSDELARHRRSHSGDKPYACRECSKSCYSEDSGRQHMPKLSAAAAAALLDEVWKLRSK